MANKHHTNQVNGIAEQFISSLKKWIKCPRRNCQGSMVEVYTQYKTRGPINKEQECYACGKVLKDSRFQEKGNDSNKRYGRSR